MEHEQGKSITLYATFLNALGTYASLATIPTITIYHYKNTVKSDNVTAVEMTHISDSDYFYRFHITDAATQTTYYVTYSVEYSDGNIVIGGEEFHVIPRKYYSKHGGSHTARVKVENSWTKKEKEDVLSIILKINDKLHEETTDTYSEFKEDLSKLLSKSNTTEQLIQGIKIPDNTLVLNKLNELKPIDMSKSLNQLRSEIDKKIDILDFKIIDTLNNQTKVLGKDPESNTQELLDIKTGLTQIKSNITKLNIDFKPITESVKDKSLNDQITELYKLNEFMFSILSKMINTDELKQLLENNMRD